MEIRFVRHNGFFSPISLLKTSSDHCGIICSKAFFGFIEQSQSPILSSVREDKVTKHDDEAD